MKILGIDEAGRGPVIGPMVMCGYLIDSDNLPRLKEIGVKDSKMMTAEKREAMVPALKKISDDYITLKIKADELDARNINKIEIEKMQHIINALNPDVAVIDAPEVNTTAFSKKIMAEVRIKTVKVISENYADKKYPEVGAASVIAKVERDKEIAKLHKQHGFFGSGYSHDETTIRFLKDWIKKNKEFPNFVRKSWATSQRLLEEKEQATIARFLRPKV